MKSNLSIGAAIVSFIWICIACQQQEGFMNGSGVVLQLPSVPYTYDTASNSKINDIATLGRVLFYDPRVSENNSISCATCHQQARAFADHVQFSAGFLGVTSTRNSMPIQNLKTEFNGGGSISPDVITLPIIPASDSLSLFWDGRIKNLQKMVLRPVTNHLEMGITDLNALAAKIGAIDDYKNLFTKAYGSSEVTQDRMSGALSQFVSLIKSDNTKFDRNVQAVDFNDEGINETILSPQEVRGQFLFGVQYQCDNCHHIEALNGYQLAGGGGVEGDTPGFLNIGLDINYKDIGFADVSGKPGDVGKFKVPTLRNVALTGPYMHDGRFQTLNDVLEHYSTGIVNHPNLDFRLKTADGGPLRMNIPEADKLAIIAFLNTLTDYSMITDPKFSNPFVTTK